MKILAVDDDSVILSIIKALLKNYAQEFYTATNGKEGLELFQKLQPDLIITDGEMPVMNGANFVKAVRKLDKSVHILFVSALDDPKELAEVLQYQIDSFIAKPIDKTFFKDTMERVREKVQADQKLRIQEEILKQYKQAIDQTTLVSKTDAAGKIIYVNDAFVKISGFTKEELMGKPHSVVRHPDMPKEVFKEIWQTIQSGKYWHGKIKNLRKDGGFYIVDANIFPHFDLSGNIYEYMAVRNDITELEEYKDILETQLDSSVSALSDKINLIQEYEKAINEANAFTRFDLDWKITFTNETFFKKVGAKKDIVGEDFEKFVSPDYKEKFRNAFKELQEKKSIKTRMRYQDSKEFFSNSIFVPIVDTEKNIIEIMGIHHDVTEIVHLNQEIENTQKEVVFTMGAIGETRSKETGNHVKRVAEYSKLLALKYGLSVKEAELIKTASPMHDIGKVGIPDSILNKPDRLTEDEFEVMKTHAELGYNMLQHSEKKILKSAAIIAYEHHEKYNGKGYPRGVKGEDIHIYGRITAIADVFDALGHARVYKPAWELDRILQLFKEERGEHFDPKLVDVFFENLDEFLKIRDSLEDEIS